jgi:hypothetical protein
VIQISKEPLGFVRQETMIACVQKLQRGKSSVSGCRKGLQSKIDPLGGCHAYIVWGLASKYFRVSVKTIKQKERK